MNWFVMPPDDATWSLPPEDFKQSLEQAWPGAMAEVGRRFNTSVDFSVPMRHARIWGTLDLNGQVFAFEQDPADCATFAVWIRTLIPSEHALIFCDESYTQDMALRPETTPEDILRAFQIEPY